MGSVARVTRAQLYGPCLAIRLLVEGAWVLARRRRVEALRPLDATPDTVAVRGRHVDPLNKREKLSGLMCAAPAISASVKSPASSSPAVADHIPCDVVV
jgi:hypothetical protein